MHTRGLCMAKAQRPRKRVIVYCFQRNSVTVFSETQDVQNVDSLTAPHVFLLGGPHYYIYIFVHTCRPKYVPKSVSITYNFLYPYY